MTLENLIGKGLQQEPASPEELRRFLNKIATKLADAQSETLSLDSRFDLAYEALLQIGLPAATQALNTPQLVSQRSAPHSAQGRFLPEFPVHRSTPNASSKFGDCPPRGRQ